MHQVASLEQPAARRAWPSRRLRERPHRPSRRPGPPRSASPPPIADAPTTRCDRPTPQEARAASVTLNDGVEMPILGATMLSWPDGLCERLAAGGRRVVRYDLRDSGESTTPRRRPPIPCATSSPSPRPLATPSAA